MSDPTLTYTAINNQTYDPLGDFTTGIVVLDLLLQLLLLVGSFA